MKGAAPYSGHSIIPALLRNTNPLAAYTQVLRYRFVRDDGGTAPPAVLRCRLKCRVPVQSAEARSIITDIVGGCDTIWVAYIQV